MPRKQQFSNKQKKQQLQDKRKRKQNAPDKFGLDSEEETQAPVNDDKDEEKRLNAQPVGATHERVNKYSLVFGAESKEEVQHNTRLSKKPLAPVNEKLLESTVEEFMLDSLELGMPKRGSWSYSMSKEKLEQAEQKLFNEWTSQLDDYYHALGKASYYERNLETWRQLWRTLEMSDIVLFVCDIRYPTLHFSYSVFKYITEDLDRQVILVLNKIDLVHPSVSVSWKLYFEQKYPNLRVVLFSAFPEQQKLVENTGRRLLKKQAIHKLGWAYGADSLIQLAKCHFDNKSEKGESETGENINKGVAKKENAEEDYVTIGMIGQPNAGKSSLINGLLEDKKVSVSKTPGHTKHFQTIFYSAGIRLCDCPGLVFPTTAPKQLQIVSGMYPVAQVREPYSVVGYVAERLDLVPYLRLQHPCIEDTPDEPWTAWYLCFAWAEKNGYLTARTGRPDVYRGANSILRLVVTGRLCVRQLPPNYHPEAISGSYKDILQELLSFAGEGKDKEGSSAEGKFAVISLSEDEDEDIGADTAGGGSNMFSLLQDES